MSMAKTTPADLSNLRWKRSHRSSNCQPPPPPPPPSLSSSSNPPVDDFLLQMSPPLPTLPLFPPESTFAFQEWTPNSF